MFWRKQPQPEFFIESTDIPTSTLFRWALYDMGVENPNQFAEAAGFTPISEEGEEFEERESFGRLTQVYPYKGFIDIMSMIHGEILAETFAAVLRKYNLQVPDMSLDEEKDAMSELYASLSATSMLVMLSAGLELGILTSPDHFISGDFHD
jgi:hypothetical protein